ncbi:hypothetical protein CR513_20057, partial [Mucuna pruriens]
LDLILYTEKLILYKTFKRFKLRNENVLHYRSWSSIYKSQSAIKDKKLLAKLIFIKYKDKGNIVEFIVEISNLAKWSHNKLIFHYVQKEKRLERDKNENVHFVSFPWNKKVKNIKDVVE